MFCAECFTIVVDSPGCPNCEGTNLINEYHVQEIDITDIYSDPDFNCRGSILPMDVIDLVRDVEQNGLQFPIALQPIKDVSILPSEDYKFRVVAGHRRLTVFKILKRKTIPAMIKIGLSEVQARLVNLGENLKRKALNIVQEANAISKLREFGLNRRQVSEQLGVSTSWVQVRFNLLDLPPEIQAEAASGLLNQYQIKEIFGLDTKEEKYEAVKKIKNARLRGERGTSVGKSPKDNPFNKRRQPKNIVQEMIDHMGATIGFGLHTRVLAWANGEINSAELYIDIRRFADSNGIDYTIPAGILND